MEVKASGRAALVIAAGFWIGLSGLGMSGLAGSAQAAPASGSAASEKPAVAKAEPAKKAAKQPAAAKADRVVAMPKPKPAGDKPVVKSSAGAALASATDADVEAPLPDTVANANAEMPAPQTAVSDRAAAEAQLVASDQLNDLDRAAATDPVPPSTVGRSTGIIAALTAHDDSPWSQTSLIGKIFIAFGGLLTAASAARMFIV
jgi:hypothetical protein